MTPNQIATKATNAAAIHTKLSIPSFYAVLRTHQRQLSTHPSRCPIVGHMAGVGQQVSCKFDGTMYTGKVTTVVDGPLPTWRATVSFEDGTEATTPIPHVTELVLDACLVRQAEMRWRDLTWLDEAAQPPVPVAEVEALVGREARSPRANKGQNEWRNAGTTASTAEAASNLKSAAASPKKLATEGSIASPVKGVTQKEDGR